MNLAIQGHSYRGNEVISYLERLGGKNPYGCTGLGTLCAYRIIDGNIQVVTIEDLFKSNEYILYSLEGILAKFPYKVGDKVIYEDKIREITKMVWEEQTNTVAYKLDNKLYCNVINKLQPYKEETTKERQYKELRIPLDDGDKLATEATINGNKILPPNGYLIGKITQMDNGMLVEYVKQKPQYPKTYEECCDILQLEHTFELKDLTIDEERLTDSFIRLKRCRDTYWKIAGVQMGLGKPWQPDWDNKENTKYCITTINRQIKTITTDVFNYFLAFPTEEMRDALYENFKDLIETCKELL